MERTAYSLLEKMESSWWYRGRAWAVRSATEAAHSTHKKTALDYGAGYGGMCDVLHELAADVDALEPDTSARAAAEQRTYRHVFAHDEEAFARKYDLIGLFDVLEHVKDDAVLLKRTRAALEPSGQLILTVPAYQALWSMHDVEHHHHRRYSAGSLSRSLQDAGYRVEYVGYWNCALLIPAAMLRALGKSGEGGLTPRPAINAFLSFIVRIEATILRHVPLPFGLSVIVVASRDDRKA